MMYLINLVLLFMVYLLLCVGIVVACICRINSMTAKRHRLGWWAMYAAMAVYAAGKLIDVALSWQWMAAHELIGLAGIALNLLLTQRHWREGPPPIACKRCP